MSWVLLIMMCLNATISLVRTDIYKRTLYLQIFLIAMIGCLQTYGWAYSHTATNRPLSEYASAINTIVGKGKTHEGVLVTDERYGSASYVLFGLASAPKVLDKPPGSSVTKLDVGDASWVLFANEYQAEFDYHDAIKMGRFTLYPLKSEPLIEERKKTALPFGQVLDIQLGTGKINCRLNGFNLAEAWGAWTNGSRASVELPFTIKGKVRLKFFSWTIPANWATPLTISLGKQSSMVKLSDSGKEYEITMDVKEPVDTLILESASSLPTNSHRIMGVALTHIAIEND